MKIPKERLAIALDGIIRDSFVTNTQATKSVYDKVGETHKMPMFLASDIMTLASPLTKYSEFDLFCIIEAIISVDNRYEKLIDTYFTEDEVKKFSTSVYNDGKIRFPYRVTPCICIRDGQQWLTKVTAKELKRLDNAVLINYNENTQRVLRRIVSGNTEYYTISINRKAVDEIKGLMRTNAYFPDPITLNISPDDEDNDWLYNESRSELVIKKLKRFDILDGYHRFVAMRELMEEDPEFDYTMELRITNWSENQAQQFIWQQDQKTKMTVADSATYNQYAPANRIVERLNTSMSAVAGKIQRNGGQIKLTDITTAITQTWFKRKLKKEDERKLITSLTKEIGNRFDVLFEDDDLSKMKYDFKSLFILMFMISKEVPEDRFVDVFKTAIERSADSKISISASSKAKTTEIETLISEITA